MLDYNLILDNIADNPKNINNLKNKFNSDHIQWWVVW